MAADNLFSRAAKYRKSHPGMTMPEAVKACSKKKSAAKKKPAKKKAVAKKKIGAAKKRNKPGPVPGIRFNEKTGKFFIPKKAAKTKAEKDNAKGAAILFLSKLNERKKKGGIGRTKKKAATKAVVPARRKVKIKIKKTKNGNPTLTIGAPTSSAAIYQELKRKGLKLPHGYETQKRTISGIHMDKTRQELAHRHSLETMKERHQKALKVKGLTTAEKARIRREVAQYGKAIKESNTHIRELKKFI